MTEREQAAAILAAYEAGKLTAEALKVGYKFRGAMPDAILRGYHAGTGECRLFMAGYLDSIAVRFPRGVLCDGEGKIVSIG